MAAMLDSPSTSAEERAVSGPEPRIHLLQYNEFYDMDELPADKGKTAFNFMVLG